jgi:hypothetical protein
MSAVLKPESPAKDSGYTLPTANWRSTHVQCVDLRAPPRPKQSFAGASGFNGREMTAVIRDAADTFKKGQLQKSQPKDCALCPSLALQASTRGVTHFSPMRGNIRGDSGDTGEDSWRFVFLSTSLSPAFDG